MQIGNPLRKIIDATRALDKGNFQARINSNLENELGILSNSFDNMAEHLQQSYDELKNTINERTLAYNELEKSASEKLRFFTLLSHELKTPLHGILSFSKLGQNKAKDADKVQEYFKNINESGQRLLSIVDEMLESAKIKSGQVEYSFSKSSLYLLILQIADEMKALLEEKNIKFICEPPKFSTAAIFDREKIGRVIRNIISNAIKLSPKKGTIEVMFSNQNPETISVEIRDKGPGIPPADIDKIFDEFFQSESGKKVGGTGLGLHICKIIIEKHNGTIYAFNNPDGKGACIGFSIPIAQKILSSNEKK
ncbi:MAG: HAMP domain-containing sensor histidine kinase, partial [Candidatus Nanoarchaeia archaeon]